MLPPGHIAAGYLVAQGAVSVLGISESHANLLLFVGALAGVAPDLDFIPFFAKHRTLKLVRGDSHRGYITHTPLFWLIVGLTVYLINISSPLRYFGLVIWLSSWSHLLGDSLEYGIRWLWPFRNQYYSLLPAPAADALVTYKVRTPVFYFEYFMVVYPKSRAFILEVGLIVAGLIVFLSR